MSASRRIQLRVTYNSKYRIHSQVLADTACIYTPDLQTTESSTRTCPSLMSSFRIEVLLSVPRKMVVRRIALRWMWYFQDIRRDKLMLHIEDYLSCRGSVFWLLSDLLQVLHTKKRAQV